MVGRVEAFYI
jgi:hypothetical protein